MTASSPGMSDNSGTPTPTTSQIVASSPRRGSAARRYPAGAYSKVSASSNMAKTARKFPESCFGYGCSPRDHYRALANLYGRGVWVGYLSPDKSDTPYGQFQPFSELERNFRESRPPFPPAVSGAPGHERLAVCIGCAPMKPAPMTIMEKSFANGQKISILPLGAADANDPLFAILIPQSTEFATQKQKPQVYRFWEPRGDGKFVTPFAVVAVKNPRHAATVLSKSLDGTSETPEDVTAVDEVDENNPTPVSPTGVSEGMVTRRMSRLSQGQPPSGAAPNPAIVTETPNKTPKRKKRPLASQEKGESPSKRRSAPVDTVTSTLSPAQRTSPNPPVTPSVPVDDSTLTKEKADKITFIWEVRAGDIEYDLVHKLSECEDWSAAGLLSLFAEDATGDKHLLSLLDKPKFWRLSFVGYGERKKAFVLKKGSETPFERLKEVLGKYLGVPGVAKVTIMVEPLED